MPEIASFRDIVELWDSREAMAAELGAQSWAVSKWWQRRRIPPEWWQTILATEVAKGAGLSADKLAELAAREPVEVRA